MSESTEQIAVIEYCEWKHIPVFHIPNGGRRDKREAARFKREGVRAGVPDLCFPVPKGGYHGLYIEMKDVNGGRVSQAQGDWIELLNANGYAAGVCWGAEDAIKTIDRYMAM